MAGRLVPTPPTRTDSDERLVPSFTPSAVVDQTRTGLHLGVCGQSLPHGLGVPITVPMGGSQVMPTHPLTLFTCELLLGEMGESLELGIVVGHRRYNVLQIVLQLVQEDCEGVPDDSDALDEFGLLCFVHTLSVPQYLALESTFTSCPVAGSHARQSPGTFIRPGTPGTGYTL